MSICINRHGATPQGTCKLGRIGPSWDAQSRPPRCSSGIIRGGLISI